MTLFFDSDTSSCMQLLDMETLLEWRSHGVPCSWSFMALPRGIPATLFYSVTKGSGNNEGKSLLTFSHYELMQSNSHVAMLADRLIKMPIDMFDSTGTLDQVIHKRLVTHTLELPKRTSTVAFKTILTSPASKPMRDYVGQWQCDSGDYLMGPKVRPYVDRNTFVGRIEKRPLLYHYDVAAFDKDGSHKRFDKVVPFPLFRTVANCDKPLWSPAQYRNSLYFKMDVASLHQLNTYVERYRMPKYNNVAIMQSMMLGIPSLYGSKLFLHCRSAKDVREIPNG